MRVTCDACSTCKYQNKARLVLNGEYVEHVCGMGISAPRYRYLIEDNYLSLEDTSILGLRAFFEVVDG